MNGTHDWFTVVSFGGNAGAPRGPWRGQDVAREALGRWQDRMGAEAGTAMAAHSIRIVGPFCTRIAAQAADISDYDRYLCRHPAPTTPGEIREWLDRYLQRRLSTPEQHD